MSMSTASITNASVQESSSVLSMAAAAAAVSGPVLIRRLMIFHRGIVPGTQQPQQQQQQQDAGNDTPHVDGGLDESASRQELSEHVLYYYDSKLHANRYGRSSLLRPRKGEHDQSFATDDSEDYQALAEHQVQIESLNGSKADKTTAINEHTAQEGTDEETSDGLDMDHATEDAVKFAGLASALYSLPNNFQPDDDNNTDDFAQEVRMSDSTIVFLPLETEHCVGELILVAQVPRTPPKSSPNFAESSSSTGGNSLAVRASLQRCHALFRLLRGGGIHRRLSVGVSINDLERTLRIPVKADVDELDQQLSSVSLSNGPTGNLLDDDAVSNNEQPKTTSNIEAITDDPVSSPEAIQKDAGSKYSGIPSLFVLRKKIRKLQKTCKAKVVALEMEGLKNLLNETDDSSDPPQSSLKDEVDEIYKELSVRLRQLSRLLKILPIVDIRADLMSHYDEYLAEMIVVGVFAPGRITGRCIVDMVPKPTPTSVLANPVEKSVSGSMPGGQHPPSLPSIHVTVALGRHVRSILSHVKEDMAHTNCDSALLAISSFYDGRLLYTHMATSDLAEDKIDQNYEISAETAFQLFEYFASFRSKSSFIADGQSSYPSVVGYKESDSVHQSIDPIDESLHGYDSMGSFMPPPPLSTIRMTDNLDSVILPSEEQIWVPLVYLPIRRVEYRKTNVDKHRDNLQHPTHIALYECESFVFIFYLGAQIGGDTDRSSMNDSQHSIQSNSSSNTSVSVREMAQDTTHNNSDLSHLREVLISVSAKVLKLPLASLLSDVLDKKIAIGDVMQQDAPSIENIAAQQDWAIRGLEIVFIDRLEHNVVVLSQHDAPVGYSFNESGNLESSKNAPLAKKKSGLVALMGRALPQPDAQNTPAEKGVLPALDCRHILASHLPLDVTLAFDDMFCEIHRISKNHDSDTTHPNSSTSLWGSFYPEAVTSDSDNARTFELCTYLPQGWIYGHSHGQRELYIFFDSAQFVTISDVQKAATQVRRDLFNDTLL
eukprot:CAMPEP_0198286048 /NCGR_PEP_ID=MMETSP1449-20131203/5215_1 /TAXON_ID=420275 /ORGANISM="Attheya septentrionalis, Strain CCMP2084" /LENGTH=998 /DNA_ID=CAMNT_0043983667 /DNA_START=225 /DNA_END=3221 /DNA_ORIENTATION=+